jgi:hypothetical protein
VISKAKRIDGTSAGCSGIVAWDVLPPATVPPTFPSSG